MTGPRVSACAHSPAISILTAQVRKLIHPNTREVNHSVFSFHSSALHGRSGQGCSRVLDSCLTPPDTERQLAAGRRSQGAISRAKPISALVRVGADRPRTP